MAQVSRSGLSDVIDTADKAFSFFEKRKWLIRFFAISILGVGGTFGYQQNKELSAYKSAVTVNVTGGAEVKLVDDYAKETRRRLHELKTDHETRIKKIEELVQ